jgi:hypothetical protein
MMLKQRNQIPTCQAHEMHLIRDRTPPRSPAGRRPDDTRLFNQRPLEGPIDGRRRGAKCAARKSSACWFSLKRLVSLTHSCKGARQ